jgi:hypothetical protein
MNSDCVAILGEVGRISAHPSVSSACWGGGRWASTHPATNVSITTLVALSLWALALLAAETLVALVSGPSLRAEELAAASAIRRVLPFEPNYECSTIPI